MDTVTDRGGQTATLMAAQFIGNVQTMSDTNLYQLQYGKHQQDD